MVAVERGGRIFIPGGGDQIEAGDQVIVAAAAEMASKLDDVLEA